MPRWWTVGIIGIAIIAFESVAEAGARRQIIAVPIAHAVADSATGD